MEITIYGCGYVGGALASLLLIDGHFNLNIMDPDPSLAGRILDLQNAAALRGTRITWNDAARVTEAQYIFFCAGASNPRGSSRYEVAQDNKALVGEIFSGTELSPDATVIVVTNPVDLVAQWISEVFDHAIRVFGTGTLIDTARLRQLIAEERQWDLHRLDTLVLGEHGPHMTPIYSHTFFDDEGCSFSDATQARLETQLKRFATHIRETQPATVFGPAKCAYEIFAALEGRIVDTLPLSTQITPFYREKLSVTADIFLSLPYTFEEEPYRVLDLELNAAEWAGMRAAAAHLVQHQ